MNAQEAREKTEASSNLDNIYKRVIEIIERASHNGSYFTCFNEVIPEDVKCVLINDGYKLSDEIFNRNEYLIKISW